MKIADIKPNQGSINIEAVVTEISEPREINKYGRTLKVATATLKDDSGEIKLTLWNDEIAKVKTGAKIRITNGYAKQFQDELQLTAGKFGKIEVIGEAEEAEAAAPIAMSKGEEEY